MISRACARAASDIGTSHVFRAALVVGASLGLLACDGGESLASKPASVAVADKTLTVESTKLSVGLKDEEYDSVIVASGGSPPYRFEILGGQLPPGLSLDPKLGSVKGRAAQSGDFEFAVRLTDANGRVAIQSLSIVVGETAGWVDEADKQSLSGESLKPSETEALATADVSNLLTSIAGMPDGSWQRVTLNLYSETWTPADLRPLFGSGNPNPSKIILAWSGFAWDSNRAQLILYGGGHANYRGNDVYVWRAETQKWFRASLPSEMVQDSLGNWNAVDGVANAPASAHTYDNNIFLPIADRMLVFGGAADSNGGHYLTKDTSTTSRKTGVYLFDPSRADPNKVGGTTGSHVKRVAPHPEILGGNMWSNRENWLNATASSAPPVEAFVNGCTGYAEEAGADVVYVRTANRVYRYQIGALDQPGTDKWSVVGRFYYAGSGSQSACGYDTARKVFLSINTNTKPFVAWNLGTPGPQNQDILVTPTDPTGEFANLLASNALLLRNCGLEYDPPRGNFKLWCGDGRVWTITPPTPISASGWTIVKAPSPSGPFPTEDIGTGILGKWKYAPNLGAFVGLLDAVQGSVWVYKPVGWVNPGGTGNLAPSVSITAPTPGTTVLAGSNVSIVAVAQDVDGSIAKVEFFANATKLGESLSAPYAINWTNVPAGSWSLTARATDNSGATRNSVASALQVNPVVQPNLPPTISLTAPSNGTSYFIGDTVLLEAVAADSDGTVTKVEFFDGASLLATDSTAPYAFSWSTATQGAHTITAKATDNAGATAVTSAVTLQVNTQPAGTVSITVQRGLGGSRVTETYLSSYHPTLGFGTTTNVQDQGQNYSTILRFAVFQSEGGPVPDAARLNSATLSIYKYSSYDMVYNLHRMLVDWSESGATWQQTGTGRAWSVPGGNGAGTDYATAPDTSGSTGFNPGWVTFDVKSSLLAFQSAPPTTNFGWRLRGVSGYTTALKRFYSSEFVTSAELRPKLVVSYDFP